MKKVMITLAALAMAGIAHAATVTNLFPSGDFESGGPGDWVEGGGGDTFSYPTDGGNPGGYGIIDDTSVTWGIWVNGDSNPLSLDSLGLTAGQTFTFVQDMKIISGASIGGLKIESWGPSGFLDNGVGNMYPASGTTNWATYTFTYRINPLATGLKIVPLWGPGSVVGFDNLGVIAPVPEALNVAITNPAGGQVVYSSFNIGATAGIYPGSVTNVAFYIDNVLQGNDARAPYGYAATNISLGSHTLMAVATDNNGNTATSSIVNVVVTNTPIPTAAITSPTNGGTVSTTSFAINANASVSPGTITNVYFYLDNSLIGNATSSPFTHTVNGALPGAHALKVVAKDGGGNTATSSVVNVTAANLAPTVAITSPANGGALLAGANVTLTAAASDDGTVTGVDFYVDGSLLSSATASPYNATWSGATLGSHALTAVAHDNGGLSTTSSVVNVTVLTTFSAYESFNYGGLPNGTPTTAEGFVGNWTCVPTPTITSGLNYPGLTTADNALSSSGGRAFVNFAAPLSSGTEWISFLCTQNGDPGGVNNGVYFLNGGTGLFCGFGFAAASATQGKIGLGSMNTTGAGYQGGTVLSTSSSLESYGTTYLVVLRIDFNTSGTNDTVSVYLNPPLHVSDPGTADQTVSSFDVGTITGVGLNVGNTTFTVDEIRRGSSYEEVAGGVLTPTVPTTLSLSLGTTKLVSWTASNTNYYQVQKSADSNNWSNLGDLMFGSAVTSIYDAAPAAFYQVEEIAPAIQEEIADGGFEVDGGNGTAFYWTSLGSQPPTRITSDFHSGTACMSLVVSNSDVTANTSDLQQNLQFAGGGSITPGNTYNFSFWAKSLGKNPAGGFVQQYRLAWLTSSGAIVGTVGWANFTASTNTWTQINAGPVVAPAGTVTALVEIFCATGGFAGDYGGVEIDDMSLGSLSPGNVINLLTPTIQNSQAFTATVMANGSTAGDATGTVQFTTNSVNQSQGTVANGIAASTPIGTLPATYTVTATYSGDATYIGSTATLTVGANFGSNPGSVVMSGGNATVVLSGIEGKNYSVERAIDAKFTQGVTNFPAITAPTGGGVSVLDTFSDLGAIPATAFYRLQLLP